MPATRRLGDLEPAVMEQLWDAEGPQTVREVHAALCLRRELAYTTVMTVLHRLTVKGLVVQICDRRAYQYGPANGRDELVATFMADALDQLPDRRGRQAALMRFVTKVRAEEAEALAMALAEVGTQLRGLARALTPEAGPCPAF
ncbi:MAG: BlaI/MecI/CopY family transcriptional regulator [Mycobacterium sp.]